MPSIPFFILGAATWTVSEYALHRFVGHGKKRTPPASWVELLSPQGVAAEFNREHLAHHADPSYFAPTSRKLLATAAVVPPVTAALTPLVGLRRAASFAAGFAVTYAAYEIVHRRIHTHPPRGRYGRWVRRHHLHHHHKNPRANHGVTSMIWDVAFGTLEPAAERMRVPRRGAPAWIFGANGEVRPELRADYEVAGAAARSEPAEPQARTA